MKDDFEVRCSFCGRMEDDVDKVISGADKVFICNECVDICYDAIKGFDKDIDSISISYEDKKEKNNVVPVLEDYFISSFTPKIIKEYLDQYVIGQDDAKLSLSVAVYNHYKRIMKPKNKLDGFTQDDDVEISKSNILLLGPTGSGKTLFASTLAKLLNVPFAIVDATTLTEAGYVGDDVENILLRLLQNADHDVNKAQKGIIYIDEIDKISRKSDNPSITRDVSGEGVQQALLKIIEGTISYIPPQGGRKHPGQECIRIDTNNILFICGGAFVGLDNIISSRINSKIIGFDNIGTDIEEPNNNCNNFKHVIHEDLIKFGLVPEIVGRLPILVSLSELTKNELKRILVEPKNALMKQYKKILSYDNTKLDFSDDSLDYIVENAIKSKLGARGLRFIMEKILLQYMYDIPNQKSEEITCLNITKDIVMEKI